MKPTLFAALASLAVLMVTQVAHADTGPKAKEGEHLIFEFKLNTPPPEGVYVIYSFRSEDGTADDRTDYDRVYGTQLVFFPGETTVSIVVRTWEDTEDEGDETMRVVLYGGKLEGAANLLAALGDFSFPASMTLTGTILNVEVVQQEDDSTTPNGRGLRSADEG